MRYAISNTTPISVNFNAILNASIYRFSHSLVGIYMDSHNLQLDYQQNIYSSQGTCLQSEKVD